MVEKVAGKFEKNFRRLVTRTEKQGCNNYSAGTNTFTSEREKKERKEKDDLIRSLETMFLHDRDLSSTNVLYRPVNLSLPSSASCVNRTSGPPTCNSVLLKFLRVKS